MQSHQEIFLHLNANQVVAARVRGFCFVPATSEQVARLTMQRRIFRVGGQDCLVTSDSGYHETHGTLMAALPAAELSRELPAPEGRGPPGRPHPRQPPPARYPRQVPSERLRAVPPCPAPGRDKATGLPVPPPQGTEEARAALRREIVERATALGFAIDTLLPRREATPACDVPAANEPRSTVAKYRGPAAGETWTGRGRRPGWLLRLLETGRNLEEFRI